MDVKFKNKIRKSGNSFCVSVPPAIVDMIGTDTVYDFIVKEREVDNDENPVGHPQDGI